MASGALEPVAGTREVGTRDFSRVPPGPRTPPYGASAVWLFLSLLVCFVALTRGHFWSSDEIAVYQQARSLWLRGDLAIDSSILNTVPGQGGRSFAPYGAGQSILALPLYGIGLGAHRLLAHFGVSSWLTTFQGPVVEGFGMRWSGDVEIFFVNLFNAFTIAALVAVFFAFNLRFGVRPRWALAASLLLAFATHIGGFAVDFFQHGAESLFLLWTFYFLFVDSTRPSGRVRALAGAAAAIMLVVRVSTAALLPVLTLYLAWNIWKRTRRPARMASEMAAFLVPVGIGLLLQVLVNHAKFGGFSIQGSYARLVPFNTPILVGLYGFLFSPGESVFLFSPLLMLAPWYLRSFARERLPETLAILGMGLSYLFFYSGAYLWHGQWSFGPRYLVAVIPILLLPLGRWLERLPRAGWLAVVPLAALGLFMEVLSVLVNVSYVYAHEGYLNFVPPYGFLYIPESSQVVAHWHALRAWDGRVDGWLIDIVRMQGIGRFFLIAVVLAALLAFCVKRLKQGLDRAEVLWSQGAAAPEFTSATSSEALRAIAMAWLAAIAWILVTRA
jgi:hypothetical protein